MRARLGTRRGVVIAVVAALVLTVVLVAVGITADRRQPVNAGGPPASGRTASAVVASDSFERVVKNGWGDADVGGAWTARSSDALAVASGRGTITFGAGLGTTVELGAVQPADVRVSVDVVTPDLTTAGGGVYTGVAVRSSGGSFYRCNLRLTRGEAFLSVVRQDGPATQPRSLVREHRVARAVTTGQVFHVVCEASGSSPVQLYATATRSEPREWQVQAVDDTASRLVGGGQTALWTYVSGSATRPQSLGFDAFEVLALASKDLGAPPSPRGSASPSSAPSKSATGATRGTRPSSLQALELGRAGAPKVGNADYAVPAGALLVAAPGRKGSDDRDAAVFPTLAAAVAAAPDGATIVLRGGVYHESVVLPPGRRLVVQSYPGEAVWLDGSAAVAGWYRSGPTWVVDGWDHFFDASPTYTQGAPEDPRPGWQFVDPAHPMAAHPDQVWVDGGAQRQVASRTLVVPGSFFVDQAARQLVLGSDPQGHEVRASTLSTALTVVGEGDVVRGIGVRRYATSVWQLGAVTVNVPRVRVADLVLEDNATTGLSVQAADVQLERVTARDNGLMGVHANHADGLRVVSLSATGNNTEQFNRAPAAGGMKITKSADVEVLKSRFVANLGHGFWCDESCSDLVVGRSRFERNTGSGLVFEISSGATIAGNVLRGNGLDGLWLINSDRVEVAGNAVVDNRRSFSLSMDDRWTSAEGAMPWVLRDVAVYDNVVRQTGSTCVICVDDQTSLVDPAQTSIRFDHNVYQRPGWSSGTPFARWPADATVREPFVDLVTFRMLRHQETRGLQVGPGEDLLHGSGTLTGKALALARSVARPASAAVIDVLGDDCSARVLGPSC